MQEWILQIILAVLALLLFGGLVYSLVFSSRSNSTKERKQYGGYDRREMERMDRRKRSAAPPEEVGERRQGPRRDDE